MWFIAAKYDPSTKQNSIDTLFGFIWETQIKITLKLPHSLKYTEGKLNLVRWLKVFGLVKISRLKKSINLNLSLYDTVMKLQPLIWGLTVKQ